MVYVYLKIYVSYHLRLEQRRFKHTLLRFGCVQFMHTSHFSALHPVHNPHRFLCTLFSVDKVMIQYNSYR